jgi:allophanate hydrolase subunit 2
MAAVVGAPCGVSVDGRVVPAQAAFPLRAGADLHVGPPEKGARVYVAFHSGAPSRARRLLEAPASLDAGPFRVVAGPQAELFVPLRERSFRVEMASNRVGIRLDGEFQAHEVELPSEPACVGTVQVAGGGGLLILGPDGPTIGGYPKVAVVVDADLDRLGQLRPGDEVRFEQVSLGDARSLRQEREARIGRQCAEIRAVTS